MQNVLESISVSIPMPHKPTATGTLSVPEGPMPTHTRTATHPHHPHPSGKHPLPPPFPEGPNGPHAPFRFDVLSGSGRTALWVFFGFFTVAFLLVLLLGKRVERRLRLLHLIAATYLGIGMLAYLASASGLGWTFRLAVYHAAHAVPVIRAISYSKFIAWALGAPLILLQTGLVSGLSLLSTATLMLASVATVVLGLFATLVHHNETIRWLIFAISIVFLLSIFYVLLFPATAASRFQSERIQTIHAVSKWWIILSWAGYPVIWALGLKGVISVDVETILFGVWDLIAGIGLGQYVLLAHSHTEDDSVVLPGFYTEPRNAGFGYGAIDQDED